MSDYPPLHGEALWPFKKQGDDEYKGLPTWEVIELDPGYVRWCIDNTDLELDNEMFEYLQEQERING